MLFRLSYRNGILEILISEKMKRFVLAVMEKEKTIDFYPAYYLSSRQVFRKPNEQVEIELTELGFDIYPYNITCYNNNLNIGLLFLKGAENKLELELRENIEVGRLFYLYRKHYKRFKKLEEYIDRKLAELQSSASCVSNSDSN